MDAIFVGLSISEVDGVVLPAGSGTQVTVTHLSRDGITVRDALFSFVVSHTMMPPEAFVLFCPMFIVNKFQGNCFWLL